jgi:glutathione S-transferase
MHQRLRLFAMPGSLYAAKTRAYLRKQQIIFDEIPIGDPSFRPIMKVVGRFIMPVVEMTDGTIVQDNVDIIDHIEASGLARLSAYPATPVHRIISMIVELFGGEGLLRPAMHYRWNFDDQNLAFLRRDFAAALAPGADEAHGDAVFANASGLMRKAASAFGVNPATFQTVEASYARFLNLFNAHLQTTPYLLGGRPTLGDYGLIGPLFAHLARDPAPASLMKATAREVWRWTERMNAPEPALDGFVAGGEDLLTGDQIPETLDALLRFIAEDWLPELAAHIDFANHWLADNPEVAPGTNGLPNPAARSIGFAPFTWRGHEISTAVMPYRFWMLQRIQDGFATLPLDAQGRISNVLDRVGLGTLLSLKTNRRVERRNYLEVWA